MPANLPPLSLFQVQTFGGSYVDGSVTPLTPGFCFRHGRACPGHPRLDGTEESKDVDARDKPGHDKVSVQLARRAKPRLRRAYRPSEHSYLYGGHAALAHPTRLHGSRVLVVIARSAATKQSILPFG